jgi:hypothetical protein
VALGRRLVGWCKVLLGFVIWGVHESITQNQEG